MTAESKVTECVICRSTPLVAKGMCNRCYQREYARRHRAAGTYRTELGRQRVRQTVQRNYALIAAAKGKPCTDCGGTFPRCAMEFDHVRGTKLFALNSPGGRTVASIEAEIAKCDLVCSNCHRIRTCDRRTDRERCQTSHV
jgi:hypothetical protein